MERGDKTIDLNVSTYTECHPRKNGKNISGIYFQIKQEVMSTKLRITRFEAIFDQPISPFFPQITFLYELFRGKLLDSHFMGVTGVSID